MAPEAKKPGIIRDLRSLMRLLSRYRDLQVQQTLLAPLVDQAPVLNSYLAKLKASQAMARKVLVEHLSLFDEQGLVQAVERTIASLGQVVAGSEAESRAVQRASDQLARIHRRLISLRSAIDRSDPATIHRLRLAFKKYRYLVEPLAPLSQNPDPDVLSKMHDLQGIMGDIQDLAVLRSGLSSWAATRSMRRETDPVLLTLASGLKDRISVFMDKMAQLDSYKFNLLPANLK